MTDDTRGLGDFEPGRRGISVANLGDGESITVQATGDVYLADTEHSDNAIHVPVNVLEAPDGFEDMSGEPVETVEDNPDDPAEYNIINSSTAFYNALVDAFGESGETEGEAFQITGHQPDGADSFGRTYSVDR